MYNLRAIVTAAVFAAFAPSVVSATDVSVSGTIVLGGGDVIISVNPAPVYTKRGLHRHHGYRPVRRSQFHSQGSVARYHSPILHSTYETPSPRYRHHGHHAPTPKYVAPGEEFYRPDYGAPLLHRKRHFGVRLR